MLYNLLFPLAELHGFFNLFRYITFRSAGALLTALVLSFIFIPMLIKFLRAYQVGNQPIREIGPDHQKKTGTPTMGGVAILASILISTLLWMDFSNQYLWVILFVTVAFGFLGFMDDFLKVTKKNHKGVRGKLKLLFQIIVSVIACLWIQKIAPDSYNSHIAFPFFKNLYIDLGWFYFVFVALVIVGSSNAVNLTDGLDGLAIVPIAIVAACFALIVYLVGSSKFASHLQIYYVENSAEIAVFCSAIVGASLGFLWFNAHPAQIFMGDTGSLAAGGAIGTISVITKHELVLAIIGGLFVIEALSVIIQVYYFKFTGGKRFFKMAPIHHHFEKCGWSETQVVVRFWILAIIFAIIGLSTLKLR